VSRYITRKEAVRLYGADDPAVDESHIFQGDIFHSLEFRVPPRIDTVLGPGIVVSHDCEYTKARRRDNYSLLVAPLRKLGAFERDQHPLIRDGKYRYLLFLPTDETLDDEYAADLRLMQPILPRDLGDNYYWTSVAQETREALQAKVVEFITRELTLR